MAKQHEATKTVVTTSEMALAFYEAFDLYFNNQPKPMTVKILLAHWALETGWGKSMYCNNVGNAKSRKGDGFDYCYFACNEVLSKVHAERLAEIAPKTARITRYRTDNRCIIWFYPNHPWCRFRAFDTLSEGAYDHLKLLVRRFGLAWAQVVSGNAEQYSRALKAQHYYTADEAHYTKAITSIVRGFDDIELPQEPLISEAERKKILAVVGASLDKMSRLAVTKIDDSDPQS
jgi:hypothetical protein